VVICQVLGKVVVMYGNVAHCFCAGVFGAHKRQMLCQQLMPRLQESALSAACRPNCASLA
jgi:hypothetical protein